MGKHPTARTRWLVLAMVAGLVIGALAVTPAIGGGLFTKQKAKSLFYTKAASDSRFLTPGAGDARFLTPAAGDDRYAPRRAATQVQVGADAFVTSLPGVVFYSVGSAVLAANTGPATFEAPLAVPSILQGQPTRLDSVVLCYAASPTATIDDVVVDQTTSVAGTGTDSQIVNDDTDRSDTACRTYAPSSPLPIGSSDALTLGVRGNFTGSPNRITITRLTVNLSEG